MRGGGGGGGGGEGGSVVQWNSNYEAFSDVGMDVSCRRRLYF